MIAQMNFGFTFASYKSEFAIASVLIGAISAIPYLKSMWNGHRPPYTTYLGWLLIGTTGFIFHYQAIKPSDEKWSALLPALYIFIPLVYITLLIALKAIWKLDTRDMVCLSGILLCWLVWVIAHLLGISTMTVPLIALVATDAFSSWPILQNAWKGEESERENQIAWSLAAISVVAGVVAVADPFSAEMIYPAYLMVLMSAICLFSLFSSMWAKKPIHTPAPWAPKRRLSLPSKQQRKRKQN